MARDAENEPGPGPGPPAPDRLVAHAPVGLAVTDLDLRCTWLNAAMAELGDGPAGEQLGRRPGEIQPGPDARNLEARMRQVLETGVPLTGYEHVGSSRADPARPRALSLSFVRLDDGAGHPQGVLWTATDVTPRHRARLRLALLDRAGRYIGRTLDASRTAQELADVAVPELADLVTVDLLDAVTRGGETTSGRLAEADAAALRRVGHRSVDAGLAPRSAPTGAAAAYRPGSPPLQSLTGGMSWREARLDPDAPAWVADLAGDGGACFADLGLHTGMVVPVRARGATLGIACFFRARRDEPFGDDDLRLAVELVDRAAVSVDNARRYTRERNAALTLQRNLLPGGMPQQQAVEVASHYRPAEKLTDVGGNWFDVIPLSGARVGLVVGDVVGHGIDAAAAMGRLRTTVQALADLDLSPEELLARLDDSVGRDAREGRADTSGATCLYAVYDPVTRQCVMAGAGHPPPAVVGPDGTVDFPDMPLGPALGVGGLPFECAGLELAEGSVIVLHTAGLLALQSPRGNAEARRERLRQVLGRPAASLDDLCRQTVDALLPARPVDDATLLLARTRVLGADRCASWDIPADPAAVAQAREKVAAQLDDWHLDDMAYTTELVTSELVTNAIRHASGPIGLRLLRGTSLICEVSDASSTSPHLRHARTTDEGGRGLFLISQFTDRWGTRHTSGGKVIWTEQPLSSAL
ncbi:SpoIIE family protein phosphatase [Streptomyces sp. NRRL F-5123]|uniref:SpoIIE family protein phosphatase n=1 Tax=Streptomyces sp. NRRL F-5123 TaxID=1463856 RepID=UPI0006932B2F|nr:SpoIIE family protein phosphatase [Streptomyces sp. NRRL F-5123]